MLSQYLFRIISILYSIPSQYISFRLVSQNRISLCNTNEVSRLLRNLNPPGGNPLYKPYRYVPPQRVGFLRTSWSENGDRLCFFFGLESGMLLKGTMGAYERIYCFNSK